MNEDELVEALVDPIRELLDRMMTLVERLTNRVEVLELEVLNRRPAPVTDVKGDRF